MAVSASAAWRLNGIIAKWIFDNNPDREFYVEERYPIDWMFPHLVPHGLIMKLNRSPLPGLDVETIDRDHQYWADRTTNMIGDWVRGDTPITELCEVATRVLGRGDLSGFAGDPIWARNPRSGHPFAMARAAIGGIYRWRMEHATDPGEEERYSQAADLAYRQAFALCPTSDEVAERCARDLMSRGLVSDAKRTLRTTLALTPEKERADSAPERLLKELEHGSENSAE